MPKQKITHRKALLILIVVISSIAVLIAVAIIVIPMAYEVYRDSKIDFANPAGTLVVGENAELEKVATTYAIDQSEKSSPGFGTGSVRKADCKLTMYGYDDKYIYAMNTCMFDDDSGYSIPTRFTYERSPLRITGKAQQGDGNYPPIEDIYPKEMYHELYRRWIE